jgi:hypothetical protein
MAYPDPRPFDSVEEYARSIHADLANLSVEELNRELGLACLRLLADDEPSEWLRERPREIEAAILKATRASGRP